MSRSQSRQKKTVIFDLDGTLADIGHRMPLIAGKKKRWREFFLASVHDSPIAPIIELCTIVYDAGYTVRILSGRSEIVREATVEWLARHTVPYHSLTMRADRDFRPDHELKALWLDQLITSGETILCIFDDRESVVEMWRRRGLTCLQVAEGRY